MHMEKTDKTFIITQDELRQLTGVGAGWKLAHAALGVIEHHDKGVLMRTEMCAKVRFQLQAGE